MSTLRAVTQANDHRAVDAVHDNAVKGADMKARRDVPQLVAGASFLLWVNQGYRHAECLAVIDGCALIEYTMPKGSTALRFVDANDHEDYNKYRSVAYRSVSIKWLRAVQAQSDDWVGEPQISGPQDHRGSISVIDALRLKGQPDHDVSGDLRQQLSNQQHDEQHRLKAVTRSE